MSAHEHDWDDVGGVSQCRTCGMVWTDQEAGREAVRDHNRRMLSYHQSTDGAVIRSMAEFERKFGPRQRVVFDGPNDLPQPTWRQRLAGRVHALADRIGS